MVVKVWDSRNSGEVEEDAMMVKKISAFNDCVDYNRYKEMPPCRQRSFVSSWPWDGGWMFW